MTVALLSDRRAAVILRPKSARTILPFQIFTAWISQLDRQNVPDAKQHQRLRKI